MARSFAICSLRWNAISSRETGRCTRRRKAQQYPKPQGQAAGQEWLFCHLVGNPEHFPDRMATEIIIFLLRRRTSEEWTPRSAVPKRR